MKYNLLLSILFFNLFAASNKIFALSLERKSKDQNTQQQTTPPVALKKNDIIFDTPEQAISHDLTSSLADKKTSVEIVVTTLLGITSASAEDCYKAVRELKNKLKEFEKFSKNETQKILEAIKLFCMQRKMLMQKEEEKDSVVEDVLLESFCKEFELLKSNPKQFIKSTSEKIEDAISEDEITEKSIHQEITQILDHVLLKMNFSDISIDGSWHDFLSIPNEIEEIIKQEVITSKETAVDLFKTATIKFCKYIESKQNAFTSEKKGIITQLILQGEASFFLSYEEGSPATTQTCSTMLLKALAIK